MKKRVGFTLVELLAVIAILAILVIIALPNVIEMFNSAKKQSFINELKTIYMAAEEQRIADTLTKSGYTAYARNSDNSCVGKLDLSGRDDIQYYIEFDSEGNVIKYYAKDGSFQYKSDKYGLKKTEITDAESIGSLDEEYIIDITCDGASVNNIEPTIPTNLTQTTFIVTYNANGGSNEPASQTKQQGVAINLSTDIPTRSGYTFNGWNSNSNGNGEKFSSGSLYEVDKDITLYAMWVNCGTCFISKGDGSKECTYNYGNVSSILEEKGYQDKLGVILEDGTCYTNLKSAWLKKSENQNYADSVGNYGVDDYISTSDAGYCSTDALSTLGFYRYFTGVYDSWLGLSESKGTHAKFYNTCTIGYLNQNNVKQLGGMLGFAQKKNTTEQDFDSPVVASPGGTTFFFDFRNHGCNGKVKTDIQTKNIKFKVNGNYYSLKQMVENGYVEPLVIIGGENFSSNNFISSVYTAGNVGNGGFSNIVIMFMLKEGNILNGYTIWQSVASKNALTDKNEDRVYCGDGTYVRYIDTNKFRLVVK